MVSLMGRGKGGGRLSPLPSLPLGSLLRSSIFFLAFFPTCGAWSQATMMRPERQKQFLKSDLNSLHLHANVRFIVTVNDLLNAFYLINAPLTLFKLY